MNEPIENAPAVENTAAPDFDAMLQNGYQAEFDRRVQQAVSAGNDERILRMQTELDGYARREQVLLSGVDPRFARFVAAEVSETMREGDVFSDALKTYLRRNDQFLAGTADKKLGWGYAQQGGGETVGGVEAAFYALNPQLKRR